MKRFGAGFVVGFVAGGAAVILAAVYDELRSGVKG